MTALKQDRRCVKPAALDRAETSSGLASRSKAVATPRCGSKPLPSLSSIFGLMRGPRPSQQRSAGGHVRSARLSARRTPRPALCALPLLLLGCMQKPVFKILVFPERLDFPWVCGMCSLVLICFSQFHFSQLWNNCYSFSILEACSGGGTKGFRLFQTPLHLMKKNKGCVLYDQILL